MKKPTKIKIKLKPIQLKIWVECRRIIKARYPHICYTCGAKDLKGANLHTGHLIAKKFLKNYLKYDLRLLRPQCYYCNLRLGGLGALFIEKMRAIEGNEYVDGILSEMNKKIEGTKEIYQFYYDLLEEYKEI